MSYKETIWNLMIAHGGVFADSVELDSNEWRYDEKSPTNYYGCCLKLSYEKTLLAVQLLKNGTIPDYEASDDPAQRQGQGFVHTFTSSNYEYQYLIGHLIVQEEKFLWGLRIDSDSSFINLLKLLGEPKTLQWAIETAEDRLTKPYMGNDTFPHAAVLRL